ncbi:filamentous hemagglutinin [Fusarium sporotrichioides]|uniref:Filamentous hemagglutinin n=1 Tax=Fusarium sporotrichioides TaxID=5514 RepID=A0A395S9B0_FUSSP|nr:filamentous hemagglutinin [Fusarium sporotrichioides]
MKLQLTLLGLVVLAFAKPQDPSDPAPAPPASSAPAEPPAEPPAPAPVPIPSSQPTPPTSPVPAPPADPAPAPPPADPTGAPTPEGPICECGYTYCAAVLKAMEKPWNDDQLSSAYCKTPNAVCNGQSPASNVDNALFICLCAEPDQKVGDHIELLCGCDACLNVGPDFRGRCKSPCRAGHGGKGGGGGGKGGDRIRGSNHMRFW